MQITEFSHMVVPFKDKLYRFAFRIVGNAFDAEDVLQEVMIKVWKKREYLATVDNKEAWCMTVTRNMAIDWIRSRKKSTQDLETSYGVSDKAATPYEALEQKNIHTLVRESIKNLPQNQSEAIHLRDIEGYTYKEISDIMDVNVSQVKVLIFRGRQKLKQVLSKTDIWKSTK
jgi:RNA polymerase sigma-70 factor (ECF subfamily)